MTLPAYIQRGGELVYQVPYAARNATQFIFLLRADAARLAATFARDFGTPSGGDVEVRPALGLVILAASRIPADKLRPQLPRAAKARDARRLDSLRRGYCKRYMPGGRHSNEDIAGTSHIGFRCVMSPLK